MKTSLWSLFDWFPTGFYKAASALCLISAGALYVWALVVATDPLELVTPAVAIGAVVVALFARHQAKRSADASQRNAEIASEQERRRRNGWVVEPHPTSYRHVLRNVGTVPAKDVQLRGKDGEFARLAFVTSSDDVTIAPGEARAFDALTTFSTTGIQISISWRPEDEESRLEWVEVLHPSASEVADRGRDAQYREARDLRREDLNRAEAERCRSVILQLGEAYASYRLDTADEGKKLKVQLLVAALPPGLAREIGFEVDVARDAWRRGWLPLEHHVPPEEQSLLVGKIPLIELIWNMRSLDPVPVQYANESRDSIQEPTIAWALRGYVERVRERESGDRQTRYTAAEKAKFERQIASAQESFKRAREAQGIPEPEADEKE